MYDLKTQDTSLSLFLLLWQGSEFLYGHTIARAKCVLRYGRWTVKIFLISFSIIKWVIILFNKGMDGVPVDPLIFVDGHLTTVCKGYMQMFIWMSS